MGKTFKLYYTTDTHSYIFPVSYATGNEEDMGILACASHFEKDGNTLILDAGDTIQGSAFAKYQWEHIKDSCVVADVFNKAGYDYVTLGNHDFNYGYEGVRRYVSELDATCLVANVVDQTGGIEIAPYAIHTLENGMKIGVVGLVTDYVPVWEKPEHMANFKVTDAFEAAKQTLETIKDQCDVTVCIYHGGFECNIETGKRLSQTKENVGYRICEELSYDFLLTGHQHMLIEGTHLFGTYIMQLMPNGQRYGAIQVEQTETGLQIVGEVKKPSKEQLMAPDKRWCDLQEKVNVWLDELAGSFEMSIEAKDKLTVAREGSLLADFCNQIQKEYTGADFSCTSLGNNSVGVNNQVTTRDIMAIYQFPNTIKVLEVTPQIIKEALERCAEYYELIEGEITISERFLVPKVEHYNYDFFIGFEYTIDVSKPLGQRVVKIERDGKPLEDKIYTIAMSDYRATGTGGYDCYKNCKVQKEYSVDIQELAIAYIREHQCVKIKEHTKFNIIK